MKTCGWRTRIGAAWIVSQLALTLVHGHPAAPAADSMREAAERFLAALTPEQRARTTFAFGDPERVNWHFVPRERSGLPFKEMTPAQRQLAHALLSTGLSQRGYVKAVTIMSLEAILRDLEGGRGPARDPELYFVTVFGKPAADADWGWRVEGHHLSVNFTLAGGHAITGAPTFFGANPAEVREGPRAGLRVLQAEEDLGRELVKSLNPEQRATVVVAERAYRDILTGAERRVRALQPAGLAAAGMSEPQRALLRRVVEEYARRFRPEVAEADLARIAEAGWERVSFAWAGGVERGQGHYYRVQGPTFLLEYDNTQNDANHIHTVWRDFANDFGEDLLRRHYETAPHEH